jgi:hypothetical protein
MHFEENFMSKPEVKNEVYLSFIIYVKNREGAVKLFGLILIARKYP